MGLRTYRLLVCGGGASNGDLLLRLARLSGRDPETTADHGVPPDYVEAAAFAWLARASAGHGGQRSVCDRCPPNRNTRRRILRRRARGARATRRIPQWTRQT
jgi:hypothetical protein